MYSRANVGFGVYDSVLPGPEALVCVRGGTAGMVRAAGGRLDAASAKGHPCVAGSGLGYHQETQIHYAICNGAIFIATNLMPPIPIRPPPPRLVAERLSPYCAPQLVLNSWSLKLQILASLRLLPGAWDRRRWRGCDRLDTDVAAAKALAFSRARADRRSRSGTGRRGDEARCDSA
jgi:hypothetical protein